MTYAANSLIEATDFNSLIGPNPGSGANLLNTVWATGSGGAGYGQSAVGNVAVGNVVGYTEWSTFITNIANSAAHQGSSITNINPPQSGNTITYLSAVSTNLSIIYTNKFNASAQSTTVANTATTTTTWTDSATFTHTTTFANGDAARYFFNSGGQLAVTCTHPSGTGINLLFNNLASNIGTVVISAMNSGNASIVGTTYNGVTKVGGGGNTPTISNNTGYFGLTTSNTTVFTQTASTGNSSYLGTNISVLVKSNGTQGSNGDTGSVITIYTVWDEVPNGILVSSGSTTTVTARVPETTYIANSWGSIAITGSVTVV